MKNLRPCPFCGGDATVGISDDEGNIRGGDYELDPWSGLCFYIQHDNQSNDQCPVAHHDGEILGSLFYDSREEAIEAWNNSK